MSVQPLIGPSSVELSQTSYGAAASTTDHTVTIQPRETTAASVASLARSTLESPQQPVSQPAPGYRRLRDVERSDQRNSPLVCLFILTLAALVIAGGVGFSKGDYPTGIGCISAAVVLLCIGAISKSNRTDDVEY